MPALLPVGRAVFGPRAAGPERRQGSQLPHGLRQGGQAVLQHQVQQEPPLRTKIQVERRGKEKDAGPNWSALCMVPQSS